jgi:hypothetical protein
MAKTWVRTTDVSRQVVDFLTFETKLFSSILILSDTNFPSEISDNCAMNDYLRTMTTNQYYDTLFENGITYQEFLNGGFFINGFDLTTSKDGGATSFSVPSVLKGLYSLLLGIWSC